MKIYINGQGFGSNLPLQGGTGSFSNATLKVINDTSNEEITTLATQYTIQNKNNIGGVLNNSWDRQAILNAGTIGLKLNSTVLAREINAQEFVNQIDTSLTLCVVYIPSYLELISDTSFVANVYDPLTVTTSGVFKIHTDHSWTITKSPAFMSITTTSGEAGTASVHFSTTGSSSQDLLTVTAGNQTISVSILYDPTASTVTVDNTTVSVGPNAESAQFTGTVQRPTLQNGSIYDRVTIKYDGNKPEWIGNLTGFNTSEVINGVVHYTFTFPLTANTGNTRSFIFTPVYDAYGQNAQGAECILQQTGTGSTITLSPNDITLDYQAQSKTIQITYTGIKNLIARSDSSWLSVGPISNNRFSYSVTQNNGTSRVGKITVSDGSVSSIATVTQSSQDKGSIRISSPSQSIPASGGTITNTVVISGSVGVISVNSSASWCTVRFSSPTITAVCAANSGSTRTATITVSATNADSVRYTITQSAAAQNYIYFENESKSIGYQGGTIINNLYTNGTTPTYTSTQSWATVSSSGVVTVSSNSSSTSRSATITAANSVGRATYTIYQTGYSTDRPIWKNTIYSETTSLDYVEYHIDTTSGTVLYAGKVYKYPNSSSVEFNVNDIISNYLDNMPFPSRDGNTSYNTWKQSFNLVTSTGRSTSYTFYNDWSYEDSLQQINPVSLIVDPNQLFVCSGTNTYFMIGNQQYTVNGTYRLDLSNLTIPCGTEIKVYNNSSLIWTYTVDDLHKDFVIYWANKYGGWDFLPIKGNSVRTDNIESNKYSRIDNYTLYDTKYLNVIKPSWKLYSGWLKGNLADLMGSVDVRLYDLKTKELYKVNITDTQTDYRTYKNSGNRLVSYEINCEMSNNYLRK